MTSFDVLNRVMVDEAISLHEVVFVAITELTATLAMLTAVTEAALDTKDTGSQVICCLISPSYKLAVPLRS